MGMFDYIHIDKSLLPLSDEEKGLIAVETVYQTKSLDKSLSDYYITNEGLFEELYDLEPDESKTETYRGRAFNPNVKTNKRLIQIDYHGFVQFYEKVGEAWFEFKAKFTDGKLIAISRVLRNE